MGLLLYFDDFPIVPLNSSEIFLHGKVLERDENDDGLMDGLDLSLDLETNQTIHFIQLFFIFSYRLKVSVDRN